MGIAEFRERRERGNEALLAHADLTLRRYLSLDRQAYEDGALPRRTKELLGLVASAVLRCDDCVTYHLDTCRELGVTTEEVSEALAVAAVVGGTITIPHLRKAFLAWEELAGPA